MKASFVKSDGTSVQLEGTPEELKAFFASPKLPPKLESASDPALEKVLEDLKKRTWHKTELFFKQQPPGPPTYAPNAF